MTQRLTVTGDETSWTITPTNHGVRVGDDAATAHTIPVRDDGDGRFTSGERGSELQAIAAVSGEHVWVSVDGYLFDFEVTPDRGAGTGARDHDALVPPMSGTVVRVAVKPGDQVKRGDTLVVLEAMKMELPIRAPRDGVVAAVHVAEGQLAQAGHAVATLADAAAESPAR